MMDQREANRKAAEALVEFERAAADMETPDKIVRELYERYLAAEAEVQNRPN
jgi:hypothetical protein